MDSHTNWADSQLHWRSGDHQFLWYETLDGTSRGGWNLNFTLFEIFQHVLGFHKESPVEINKRQIKPWREMDNYDITRFQLGMKDKAVDCFPLRSFFSLCWGTRSSRNGLAVPGVFLQAQIQRDRSVGNNWCVFLTEHFVNRKPGIYFLMKKKKNLVAKEWAESLAGPVRTWLSEQ